MDQPNRIDAAFSRLNREGRKGFVAYIAAGDPDLERTFEIALALEAAGVDLLELGVPFSDPLADGIVNQLAAARALASGTTLPKLLAAVRKFRERSQLPIVLFTYLNPVYAFGFERFLEEAVRAGVDGALFLDLPPDEAACHEELRAQSPALKMIRLVAPTTPIERVREIAAAGGGFLYVISREGVTGEQTELAAGVAAQAASIRTVTDLPLAIGFGISTPEQARAAAEHADAVVVGSAIVKRVGEFGATPDLAQRVADFVRPLVAAVKSV
jgi:tryptophan synthase alpha chain